MLKVPRDVLNTVDTVISKTRTAGTVKFYSSNRIASIITRTNS
jgi:hypothetical protein